MTEGTTAVVSFGSNYILELDDKPGVLFWTCPFMVDGDGHPECYHPEGSPPGLDYLANAGQPGNWWGVACDSAGHPFVQHRDEVNPGFYVSTTALIDGAYPESSPSHYVHSGEVPFIVLPSSPKFSSEQGLGDLAMCFNNATGCYSWAIYADIGPSDQLGEGSMALAEALDIDSDPKTGGTSEESIAMIFFPGSGIGWPSSNEELALATYKLFAQWGGLDSCRAGLPQFDWDQFDLGDLPIPAPPVPEVATVTLTIEASSNVRVKVIRQRS